MVSIPEGLPAWAQGVITIMVLVGFGFGIWRAAVKPGDAPSSATVISATIADGQAVRDLTAALNQHRLSVEANTAQAVKLEHTMDLALEDGRRDRALAEELCRATNRLADGLETSPRRRST